MMGRFLFSFPMNIHRGISLLVEYGIANAFITNNLVMKRIYAFLESHSDMEVVVMNKCLGRMCEHVPLLARASV